MLIYTSRSRKVSAPPPNSHISSIIYNVSTLKIDHELRGEGLGEVYKENKDRGQRKEGKRERVNKGIIVSV